MTVETTRPPRTACRLQSVRVRGSHGAFDLTRVEHEARRFAPHFFTTYAVGVVETGRCRITTPRGSWVAGPGSLLAFAPRAAHSAQVISEEPYAYRMAYLSNDCMRELGVQERGGGAGPALVLTPVLDPSTFSPGFVAAHREVLHDPGSDAAARALLLRTRAMLQSAVVPDVPRCSRRDEMIAETAKGCLIDHIGRHLTLDRLAESCGVTAYHLIRVFRRVTGFAPYSYLMVLRVNEARRLLDTGASISDAVHSCCFSDQSHLTRVFKRTLGLPPGQYLRATAGVGNVPGGRTERCARRVSPHPTDRPCCD